MFEPAGYSTNSPQHSPPKTKNPETQFYQGSSYFLGRGGRRQFRKIVFGNIRFTDISNNSSLNDLF